MSTSNRNIYSQPRNGLRVLQPLERCFSIREESYAVTSIPADRFEEGDTLCSWLRSAHEKRVFVFPWEVGGNIEKIDKVRRIQQTGGVCQNLVDTILG